MNSWLCILALSLLVLARPALAEPNPAFAWDLSVAPAIDDAGDDQPCRANPYALIHRGCPDELNPRPERFAERLNVLDQLLLLADHYKDMNLRAQLRPSTQLKFTMGLVNLYEQEAQARLELKIRF